MQKYFNFLIIFVIFNCVLVTCDNSKQCLVNDKNRKCSESREQKYSKGMKCYYSNLQHKNY